MRDGQEKKLCGFTVETVELKVGIQYTLRGERRWERTDENLNEDIKTGNLSRYISCTEKKLT